MLKAELDPWSGDWNDVGTIREIRLVDTTSAGRKKVVQLPVFNVTCLPRARRVPLKFDIRCLVADDAALPLELGVERDTFKVLDFTAFSVGSRIDLVPAVSGTTVVNLKLRGSNRFLATLLGEPEGRRPFYDSALHLSFRSVGSVHRPVYEGSVQSEFEPRLWLFTRRLKGAPNPLRFVQYLEMGKQGKEPALLFVADGLPTEAGIELWNAYADTYSKSKEVASGHPASFVPHLEAVPGAGWRAIYRVRQGSSQSSAYDLDPNGKTRNESAGLVETLAFHPSGDGEVRLRFPLVKTHHNSPLQGTVRVEPPELNGSTTHPWLDPLQSLEGLVLHLKGSFQATAQPQRSASTTVRMGALDVRFSGREATREGGHVQIQPGPREEGMRLDRLDPAWVATSVARVKARIHLAVDAITAGSQDDSGGVTAGSCEPEEIGDDALVLPVKAITAGSQADSGGVTAGTCEPEKIDDAPVECLFARRAPLVIGGALIPAGDDDRQARAPAFLDVDEVGGTARRTIRLTIQRLEPDQESERTAAPVRPLESAIILDSDPFLVALVRYSSLISNAESNAIAFWSYDGFNSPSWRLRLGHAARIELRLPPQGVGEEMERYRNVGRDPQSGEETVLDFRFSPPAMVDLSESSFEREFPEAPWNMRWLLGDEHEEVPGVIVERLQYELLYGLSCRLDRPLLRMAEVVARVGAVPGPLPARPRWLPYSGDQDQVQCLLIRYRRARMRWAETFDQLQTRLAVFEAWNHQTQPWLSRRLDVTCQIRPADLATADDQCGDRKLCGGVLYGIEQPAIYEALRAGGQPSNSGTVEDLSLSSLGGWGHQSATFGPMSVIADVAMGRTHSLRIEVVGRIACAWNKARHVVVYERTPGPSRQFACYQNRHQGRPILRKTQEFVEILEPRRSYPDTPAATPRYTGPVHAWVFEEGARFNVLSFWGERVGDQGWKIPIWRRNQRPTELYPEPQVAILRHAGVEGERRLAPCYIKNPEDIHFYTEFRSSNDPDRWDPDRWPPVLDLDWVDEAAERPRPDFSGGRLEQRSRPDVAVPPGFAPCTFYLKPASYATDVTAERAGEKPLGAHLSTLTFSRAAHRERSESDPVSVQGLFEMALQTIEEGKTGDSDPGRKLAKSLRELRDGGPKWDLGSLSQAISKADEAERKRLGEQLDLGSCGDDDKAWNLCVLLKSRLGLTAPPDRDQILDDVERSVTEAVATLRSGVGVLQRSALSIVRQAEARVDQAVEAVGLLRVGAERLGQLGQSEGQALGERIAASLATEVRGLVGTFARPTGISGLADERLPSGLALLPEATADAFHGLLAEVDAGGPIADRLARVEKSLEQAGDALTAEAGRLEEKVTGIDVVLDDLPELLRERFDGLGLDEMASRAESLLQEVVKAKKQELADLLRGDGLFREVEGRLAKVQRGFEEGVDAALRELGDPSQLTAEKLLAVARTVEGGMTAMIGMVVEDPGEAARTAFAVADRGLRLMRAFGAPPQVEGMAFDRPEIAYYFKEGLDAVGLTPVIARAQQVSAVADALKPLGVALPALEITDKLVPAALQNFDLSSILPNVAGIDLRGLFPALKTPADSDVRLHHGIDPETRRPWLDASFRVKDDGRHALFATSALSLVLARPELEGKARVAIAADGRLRRETEGRMSGDWELVVGNRSLVRFRETLLFFDGDGNVDFRISPEKMELDQTLQFVQKFLEELNSDDGSTLRIEPTGVVSELSFPIPNLQAGSFGISNLHLGCQLALRFDDGFAIEVGFNLAKPDAPFTLTVFVLGGAGYLNAATRYVPATGKYFSRLDLAIAASASLAISLGPIEGGVFVYFGINARYDEASGRGLDIALFILVRGHVSVLGIVSATVTLRLEASYGSGRQLVGRGHLSIRIKICWCFTLEVKRDVTYKLGKVPGGAAADLGLPGPTLRLAQRGAGAPTARPNVYPALDPNAKSVFHQRVEEYLAMVA